MRILPLGDGAAVVACRVIDRASSSSAAPSGIAVAGDDIAPLVLPPMKTSVKEGGGGLASEYEGG